MVQPVSEAGISEAASEWDSNWVGQREGECGRVGLKIDKRMRWGPMVDKLAKKARQRIGAL